MTLIFLVLFAALVFEYINGFHDAANAIATVVSTKVLTPRTAILLAAGMNLVGAMLGVQVAKTIQTGYVNTDAVTMEVIFAALLASVVWGLVTWVAGIPSSSSHALIGGLCGAVLANTNLDWGSLIWNAVVVENGVGKHVGLWPKLIQPMLLSPLFGMMLGAFFMLVLTFLVRKRRPMHVQRVFGKLQIISAAGMGLSHGMNDAQKTMGIVTLALFAGTNGNFFEGLPGFLSFLRIDEMGHVPRWVQILCAVTIAAGTAGGGWRIIRTMGHKMVRLQPVHGFAAETSAGLVIQGASALGIPLSTTHVISTSIMGVGATKRFSAVKWGIVGRIVWAWVLTLPATAAIGYGAFQVVSLGSPATRVGDVGVPPAAKSSEKNAGNEKERPAGPLKPRSATPSVAASPAP
ncbi:MAG: inorganic phosphate transporter [Puniceicoccales bacterium]|jgi:PiT family inorganic phosphate transporter|nr:inorganic phosphate transporter [Puniceicoccales bacterium]